MSHVEYWQTCDYGGKGKKLNLSRGRLGSFVYHLFRLGGNITSTYVMRPEFDKSYVQMSITLPEGKKEQLEQESGFALEPVSSFTSA